MGYDLPRVDDRNNDIGRTDPNFPSCKPVNIGANYARKTAGPHATVVVDTPLFAKERIIRNVTQGLRNIVWFDQTDLWITLKIIEQGLGDLSGIAAAIATTRHAKMGHIEVFEGPYDLTAILCGDEVHQRNGRSWLE